MMMADSSSGLGLCIAVRPESHKAETVEDLRGKKEQNILVEICIGWVLGYWSNPPLSSADIKALTCQEQELKGTLFYQSIM